PHGVEVSRFRPAAGERDNDILMLGNWLRDFPLAAQVFRALDAAGHGLRVTAVALPENLALLKDLPGVSCREGLSDDQLLDLMQRSRVLFLPLKRLTANNAILEAAACGCRVALALHRPLNPTGYFPGLLETISVRPAEAAEQLASLVAEQDARGNELAAYARAHYAWETVARSTELILKTLKA
ncbi:MAG TPA: glycosyltransferase, partial [Bacteroidales bacterium]|nr:glycosyltransferase [Bacteroidales bacterium]